MISRREVSKKLTTFRTSNNVRCLQTEGFPKKFQRDEAYPAGFVVKMIVAFGFHCETFCIDN